MLTFTHIAHRLGAAFGALLAVFLVSALLVGLQLRQIDAARTGLEQARVKSGAVAEWITLVSGNLSRAIVSTRLDQATNSDDALRQQLAPLAGQLNLEMAASADAAQKAQERMTASGGAQVGAVAALVDRINAERSQFVSVRASIRDDLLLGDVNERIEKELLPSAAAMEQSLAKLQAQLAQDSAADAQALGDRVTRAREALLASSGLALLAGVLLAWRTARAITVPLKEAAGFASTVSAGDLAAVMVVRGRDEIADVQKAMLGMQRSLRDTLSRVRQSTDSITLSSAEIATGNLNLSTRTEQTASNLQEAAASMEQLTATLRQSADSARQANQLASSASEIAARGGQVVGQVVTTMDEINASSKKISDIIGVIDAIAFQTNILALNAAVEAARAGEQGRGFAVVAGEVRNLAQRSAEAAKEIKGLIGSSVNRVEAGSRLVAEAGQTMSEIVGSVQRVSDIIGEVTAAAGEQSQGIAQVNTVVSQLDQMTQQNAALVEESAAAAESLKDQAARLGLLVQAFRIHASDALAVAPALIATPIPGSARAKSASFAATPVAQPPQRPPGARAPIALPASTRGPTPPRSKPATVTADDGDWESF